MTEKYFFDLNDNRTELLLKGVLEDKIATDSTEYGDYLQKALASLHRFKTRT